MNLDFSREDKERLLRRLGYEFKTVVKTETDRAGTYEYKVLIAFKPDDPDLVKIDSMYWNQLECEYGIDHVFSRELQSRMKRFVDGLFEPPQTS